MAYKYKVYVNNDREYFEYSFYDGSDWLAETTVKYDYNFTETLLEFLYIDIYAYSENTETIRKALQLGLYPVENAEESLRVIEKNIEVIADIHPFFKLVELDMKDWLYNFRAAVVGNKKDIPDFQYKKISHIPAQSITMQKQILDLIRNVLDVNSPDEPVQKKMAAYYWGEENRSSIERFQFEPLPTNFEMVDDEGFTDVLYPKNIYDMVDFFVRQCVRTEQVFKVCKNCGKYFNVTRYQNTDYCGRVFEDGKTCKEIGATKAYQHKINENPIINAYNRSYKTHFARIRLGKITKDEFSVWSEEARKKRDACLEGRLSLEDFKAWLKI